jgi:hypothetical protein
MTSPAVPGLGAVTAAPARWSVERSGTATPQRVLPLVAPVNAHIHNVRRLMELEVGIFFRPGTWPIPDFFDWDGTNPNMEAKWDEFPWGKGPIDQVGS